MKLDSYNKYDGESDESYKIRLRKEFINLTGKLKFKGKNIIVRVNENDGNDTFDHITSNLKNGERKFDYNRAKYTLNIIKIIEFVNTNNEIIMFKDGNRYIIYMLEENNDFMIVLEEENQSYILITAFKVNRYNSRNHYYKDKILELDKLNYSHNLNFTKIYKLSTNIKEIYIDETVKIWIEDFYTQDIIYRIIANAIKNDMEKIYFMVYKNQHVIPSEIRKYVYVISKYSNSLSDKKLLETMELIESSIKILEKIYSLKIDNNSKLIKMYYKLENTVSEIAKKYGNCKILYNCIKTIEQEVGFFAPSSVRYKLYKQFPEITKALISKNEVRIKNVYDKYKLVYDNKYVICDSDLKKYYNKYIKGFLIEFSKTIYGS